MEKKTSEAQRRASDKYDAEHIKRLSLAMNVEEFERMEEHLKNTGQKRNRFIRDSIAEKIDREQQQ